MYKSRPLTQLGRRLEDIRLLKGFRTLKAFWEALTKDDDYEVSYEAVRNYHFNREPPVAYVRQVAKVFGVRLQYLIDGEEPALVEEEAYQELFAESADLEATEGQRILDAVFEAFPPIRSLPIHVQGLFVEVWSAYSGTGWVHSQVPFHLHPEYGHNLARLLLAPFEVRKKNPSVITDEFVDYAVLALQALKLATRVPEALQTDKKG